MTETESESAALRDTRIDELERQRDMLLGALKKIEQVEAGTVTTSYDMRRIARAAIAAVEGEK